MLLLFLVPALFAAAVDGCCEPVDAASSLNTSLILKEWTVRNSSANVDSDGTHLFEAIASKIVYSVLEGQKSDSQVYSRSGAVLTHEENTFCNCCWSIFCIIKATKRTRRVTVIAASETLLLTQSCVCDDACQDNTVKYTLLQQPGATYSEEEALLNGVSQGVVDKLTK